MGSHNKVLLRWRPADVFWPVACPQLNCPDQRFQWLNLHAYGKKGCLCTHVFPPLAYQFEGLTDEEVVALVVACLQGMFPGQPVPEPLDWHVTHWDEDPYSLGSYSYQAAGAHKGDVKALAKTCSYNRIFWAGEAGYHAPIVPSPGSVWRPANNPDPDISLIWQAAAEEGRQCVHGASMTGTQAAVDAMQEPWKGCVYSTPNTFSKSPNAFDMLMGFGDETTESDDDDDE